MPQPNDIIGFVESATGHAISGDEAITFGSRSAELTGVTVAWTVNCDTVSAAAEAGHNCIVHHEALTLPYPGIGHTVERHYLSWPTNTQRLSALGRAGMTAMRLHGSLDELYIFDEFARQLGLCDVIQCGPHYAHKVFASPAATFGALVERVKRAMDMPAIRTTVEDPERPVRRIGLPWGGLGLFTNVDFMQALIDLDVDTFICGETDNYGFRFAAESGVASIETSHETGEVGGLRLFADALGRDLGIDVRFVDTPRIWRMA